MHPPARALRPTLWPPVAAAALLLLLLIPSAGHAATASQRIAATATAADLDPSASWHGRSVRRVVRTAAPAARRTGATAWFDLRPGAGYATARGSAAVRMLQRRLRKLGYSPGPVDGRYGPRTRDAVGWFQLKHGLRVDGVAGAATQRRLEARVSRSPVAGTGRRSEPSTAERFTPAATTPARARPVRTTHAATPSAPWALAGFGVLGVLGVLAAAGVGARLRRRHGRGAPEGTVISLAQPLHVEGHSSDPAIGDFAGTAAALHVSPPTEGTEASPTIRYCVIDDATHTSVWVAAEAIRERRPVTTPGPRTTVPGAASQPAGEAAWAPAVARAYATGQSGRPGASPCDEGRLAPAPPPRGRRDQAVGRASSLGRHGAAQPGGPARALGRPTTQEGRARAQQVHEVGGRGEGVGHGTPVTEGEGGA